MLGQRVLTAIVLLTILGSLLFYADLHLSIIAITLITIVTLWEWLRLTFPPIRLSSAFITVSVILLTIIVLFVALILGFKLSVRYSEWLQVTLPKQISYIFDFILVAILELCGRLAIPILLVWLLSATISIVRFSDKKVGSSWRFTLLAFPTLLLFWSAVCELLIHQKSALLLSIMALVWLTDSAAYFVGRCWGRHLLAPTISPGKTIEGAMGGLVAAVLWVVATHYLWPESFGHLLVKNWTFWPALLFAMLLGGLAIMGDLFQSLLKRRAGQKDSSRLLPGHGGIFDRIDALIPVVPAASIASACMTNQCHFVFIM